MIDILLKYILWHDFLSDLDAQRDFDKHFVTKKLVRLNHSYLRCALGIDHPKNVVCELYM